MQAAVVAQYCPCTYLFGAVPVGDNATGLFYQKHASGHIPRLQFEFPKSVQPPAGNVRQIQGR